MAATQSTWDTFVCAHLLRDVDGASTGMILVSVLVDWFTTC